LSERSAIHKNGLQFHLPKTKFRTLEVQAWFMVFC
jgi:hypothetical protein